MTEELWEEVGRIFNEAVKFRDPAERAAYVVQACEGQDELRTEIASLLSQHDMPDLSLFDSLGGKTVLQFDFLNKIGEGGMGIVYRARDAQLRRIVAVKVLKPWMRLSPDEQSRLIHEARHASGLNHPNVVTIHDIKRAKGLDLIVMEYVPGTSLDRLIPPDGLQVLQVLHYAVQMADGLLVAHSAGLLHGDITPKNVMVTVDERVKLLDFGLARVFAESNKERVTPASRGTKVYMAPEQHFANPVFNARSEIFSFGMVLHQMLGGRHPFESGSEESIIEAIKTHPPHPLPHRVPLPLAAAIERCLQKSPERRFESIKELLSELTVCRDHAAKARGAAFSWALSGSGARWELQTIRSREEGKETIWRYAWKDIGWAGDNEAWLCGEIDSGGPHGDVGTGVLLHTTDRGVDWTRIDNENFGSGRGDFSWGGNPQSWQDIGPIGSLHVYRRNIGGGKRQVELWLAATSGIYASKDGGQSWTRSTPRPDDARYVIPHAHYGNLFRIVSSEEVFAVGWQGITSWSARDDSWSLQLPACSYLITAVDGYPNDSPNWDVWAVGQSGDRRNPFHLIYHLKRPRTWERLPAEGIEFDPRKGGLRNILMVDHKTGFAVGPDGVIVKGTKGQGGAWRWTGLPKVTESDLNSIVYVDDTLWIVGHKGTVLGSRDLGETWEITTLKNEFGVYPDLHRIRSFNDCLWITGTGVVYRRTTRAS